MIAMDWCFLWVALQLRLLIEDFTVVSNCIKLIEIQIFEAFTLIVMLYINLICINNVDHILRFSKHDNVYIYTAIVVAYLVSTVQQPQY